jgi:maleate cis-trans isomerase
VGVTVGLAADERERRSTRPVGWAARIGLLVPSINTVVESELHAMAPPGVAFLTARLVAQNDISNEEVEENLTGLVADVDSGLAMLPLSELDGIAFCCTSASFYRGGAWDRELGLRIEKSCGKPAVTTSSAFVDALRALGVSSVAVGSPYVDVVNERLRTFLETNGFVVPSFEALHTETAFENGNHQPGTIKALAHRADLSSAEAVFLPCTNFPSASVIEELEQELGKPVVSANQATLWQILRTVGVDEPIDGYGEVFRLRSQV